MAHRYTTKRTTLLVSFFIYAAIAVGIYIYTMNEYLPPKWFVIGLFGVLALISIVRYFAYTIELSKKQQSISS